MAVAGPPGGLGEDGRAVDDPEGVFTGEVGRGEDWRGVSAPMMIEDVFCVYVCVEDSAQDMQSTSEPILRAFAKSSRRGIDEA
jgi:hypothetical protein